MLKISYVTKAKYFPFSDKMKYWIMYTNVQMCINVPSYSYSSFLEHL
jgi:hypothetical protein